MPPTARLASAALLLAAACAAPRRVAPPPAPARAPASAASPAIGARGADYLRSRRLIVPVAGVRPERVPDTFNAKRGTRRHNALDILAPRGTPVLAADSGRILRVGSNPTGGLTVYATDPAERLVYYYAHLDRHRERLAAGMRIAKGDTIGYVGTTGNAPRGVPHLHFQVMWMHPGGKYWAGEPVDPRPFFATSGMDGGRR